MNWLLTEIAVALGVAALVGVALGLLLAWALRADDGGEAMGEDERSHLEAKISSLEEQNDRLRAAYAEARSEQLEAQQQPESHPISLR